MAIKKRLIWGDIAERQLMKLADYYNGSFSGEAFERAANEISILPSVDAVEVVRCKDCEFYREKSLVCVCVSCVGDSHANWYPNDFCSYGERRTDG